MRYKNTRKVLAYITSNDKLLVFTQPESPEAGIQVPAGTIEPDESPESAVIREIYEESGLTDVRLISKLGKYYYDMSLYREEVQERHVFHLEIVSSVQSKWRHYETNGLATITESGIAFDFFWVKLSDPISLMAGQGEFLHLIK